MIAVGPLSSFALPSWLTAALLLFAAFMTGYCYGRWRGVREGIDYATASWRDWHIRATQRMRAQGIDTRPWLDAMIATKDQPHG